LDLLGPLHKEPSNLPDNPLCVIQRHSWAKKIYDKLPKTEILPQNDCFALAQKANEYNEKSINI